MIVDIPNAQNISKPLKRVTAAASKRSEIESCVLIESTADALTLTTIDAHTHELKLRVAEAIVCQEGQALINANLIKDLFGHLDNQAVNLSVTEKELFIKGEADVRLQLSSFNIAQFPQEEMSLPVVGKVNGEQFLSVLSRSRDLLSAGEFVSLVANQDKLTVYTRSGGSLFSRMALDLENSSRDWEIEIPVDVLKYLPTSMVTEVEIRLHENFDSVAFCNPHEHLLIKQVVNDTTSREVESWISKPAPDYVVVKSEPLQRDLSRAMLFKDSNGLSFKQKHYSLITNCASGSVGSGKTAHAITESGGSLSPFNVDPGCLLAAMRTLSAVDVVIEQIKETIEGLGEVVWLRLSDFNRINACHIIVATLV